MQSRKLVPAIVQHGTGLFRPCESGVGQCQNRLCKSVGTSGHDTRPSGCGNKQADTALVLRLERHIDGYRALLRQCEVAKPEIALRDSVCALCEMLVCKKLDISAKAMRAKTRSSADVALARQIAMYLAHTMFSVLMTEVGLHFDRDRTTVAHACAVVEDRRDEFAFDTMMCQLETALQHAFDTIEVAYVMPGEVQ